LILQRYIRIPKQVYFIWGNNMTKIVINRCHGGFGLSEKAQNLYIERKGISEEDAQYWFASEVDRDDPLLVQIVEELGIEANGEFARLKVVEIPDDVEWYVDEYDGTEWVAEVHRVWS